MGADDDGRPLQLDGRRRTRWLGLVGLALSRLWKRATQTVSGRIVATIAAVAVTIAFLLIVTGVALALADGSVTTETDAEVQVAAEEDNARVVFQCQLLDVAGDPCFRRKLPYPLVLERHRRCERVHLFTKALDDSLDVVRLVLADPLLLSSVALSFRDDSHRCHVFLERVAVLDCPDESGFCEFRTIEWDDERHTYRLHALPNNFEGRMHTIPCVCVGPR